MSKIETTTRTSKVKTFLCGMCGLQARHVADVNRHAMCPRCFSDYFKDRFGKQRMRLERNPKARNRQASIAQGRNKQNVTVETALV
jgi:hypothetical protein